MPTKRICIAGCPTFRTTMHKFPPQTDMVRRELWFRKFGLDAKLYANKQVLVCRRHFSNAMTRGRFLRFMYPYPDVNLRKYDEHLPFTEQCAELFIYGIQPQKVLANANLRTESSKKRNPPIKNADSEFTTTDLFDTDVAEITVSQSDDEQKSAEIVEFDLKSTVPRHKRQCILKCEGGHKFHILPPIETELERRKKWLYLLAADPDLYPGKYHYVCDLHFDIHMVGMRKLIRGAYPNKNLPPPLQKSIPDNMKEKTECFQKCTNYTRKYAFPSGRHEGERRKIWIQKFGSDQEFNNQDLYACDRHFSQKMRVGPYLRREAVPDQNLKKVEIQNHSNSVVKKWIIPKFNTTVKGVPKTTVPTFQTNQSLKALLPQIQNNVNFVSKNWSIKKLNTLGKDEPITALPIIEMEPLPAIQNNASKNWYLKKLNMLATDTPRPAAQVFELDPSKNKMVPAITNNANFVTIKRLPTPTNATPKPAVAVSQVSKNNKPFVLSQRASVTAPTPTPTESPRRANILNRLNMTILPPIQQVERPHSPVQYVKMHTLGVFLPRQKGYVAAVDKISSAEDPLDMEKHRPTDWVDPIEPELTMDVQVIERENYENASGDDEQTVVETSESDEVYSEHEESVDENWPTSAKRKRSESMHGEMPQLGSSPLSDKRVRTEEFFYVSGSETETNQLSTYPTEIFSIVLSDINKVIECKKKTNKTNNMENIIIPDEHSASIVVNGNNVATTSTSKLPVKPSSTVSTAIKSISSTENKFPQQPTTDFADRFLMQQRQLPQRKIVLTNEVALAESWQEVIETMKKNSQNGGCASIKRKSAQKENGKRETNVNSTKTAVTVKTKPHQPKKAIGLITANQLLSKPTRLANTTTDNYCNVGLSSSTVHKVNKLRCILNCVNFKILYAFPSAETEPQRRHFWFLELGLEIKPNWHKYLYICDRHFEESMLIENTLHKYAYPCKGLKHQIRSVGTQTNKKPAEQHNYMKLLSDLRKLEKFDSQQAKEISRIRVIIRLKQEAIRLVAEIKESKVPRMASENN